MYTNKMLVSFLMTLASIFSLLVINLQNRTYFEQRQLLIKGPEPEHIRVPVFYEPIINADKMHLLFNDKQMVLVGKTEEPDSTNFILILCGPLFVTMFAYVFCVRKPITREMSQSHISIEDLERILERGRGY